MWCIAIENGNLEWVFLLIAWWCSIVMLNCQRATIVAVCEVVYQRRHNLGATASAAESAVSQHQRHQPFLWKTKANNSTYPLFVATEFTYIIPPFTFTGDLWMLLAWRCLAGDRILRWKIRFGNSKNPVICPSVGWFFPPPAPKSPAPLSPASCIVANKCTARAQKLAAPQADMARW